MILSFHDSALEALYHGKSGKVVKRIPVELRPVLFRKLAFLEDAHDLVDLRSPPSNRLEALKGTRRGFYSIRVNDQWRLLFRWIDGAVHDLEFADYH